MFLTYKSSFRTVPQVKHWLQWAVRQFNLSRIKLSDWCLTGSQLCEMEFTGITNL